jgi:hypothetical protein
LQAIVGEAATKHRWTLGPPRYVDSTADGIRIVGCEVEIHAAPTEDGEAFSPELDRRSLDDTKALIDLLLPVSGRHHVDIGLELGGESVGWLMSGEPDRLVRDGLIGPWEAHIESSNSVPDESWNRGKP